MNTDEGVHVVRKVVIAFGLERVCARPPKVFFLDCREDMYDQYQ
jgi:hypothetical protein